VPRTVTVEERRARLARRHHLLPETRVDGPDAVARIAEDLVALHSTDPVTVFLSAMVRMRDPSVQAVERSLYDDRAVVRHHGMRRTLWVATPDVVRLIHVAATRKLVGPEHRRTARLLADNGVADPEGWLADARRQVLDLLEQAGPLTARALGDRVPALRQKIVMAPGKSYSATVSAHTRVLLNLGFEGHILRARPTGTWINGAYTYAAAHAWLDGGLPQSGSVAAARAEEREAAAALALRWLRRFGPGTSTDLQWWAGWTSALTRAALEDCGAERVLVADGTAWVAPGDDEPEEPAAPWVALLPGLDPTTMGWKERTWYLPPEAAGAFDRMGNAGPTIWADGQVVGAWVQTPDGDLRTRLFGEVGDEQRAAVERRAAEVAAMIGGTRFTVRFPSPASTALLREDAASH
jgi:winged helix DNA-binding protein